MKKRVISGCVTVMRRCVWICSRKSGTTDPREPSTLPKRTAEQIVGDFPARCHISSSVSRFVAPITDEGLTALSLEIITTRPTPSASQSVSSSSTFALRSVSPSNRFPSAHGV